MQCLTPDQWRRRKAEHADRLRRHAMERTERMAAQRKHPIDDFLFEYFSFRPTHLLRWSPGADVVLAGASADDIEWKEFVDRDGGRVVLAQSFPEQRRPFLLWAIRYFEKIAERPPLLGCFGLHEWAMVYRPTEIRHAATPLRLSLEQIAAFVESEGLRCTHFDAYRFFTPAALPLNRLALTRENTADYDQKGCLHVTMDLYKYAYKIAPWSSGELIADAFLLAWEARQIDMRASPYDLRAYGLEPIPIETRAGKDQYVGLQIDLSRKADGVRERLIGEYRSLMLAAVRM